MGENTLQSLTSVLNVVAKSEFIVQVVLSALLVIGGCYIQVLLMLPMTVFTGHKICKKSTGGIEVLTSKLLEPAEIYGLHSTTALHHSLHMRAQFACVLLLSLQMRRKCGTW
eukprot:SAG31_NODE_1938_length_6865_cov_15.342595_3_plen_112_part_00